MIVDAPDRSSRSGVLGAPCQIWVHPGISGWLDSTRPGLTASARTDAGTGGPARTQGVGIVAPSPAFMTGEPGDHGFHRVHRWHGWLLLA